MNITREDLLAYQNSAQARKDEERERIRNEQKKFNKEFNKVFNIVVGVIFVLIVIGGITMAYKDRKVRKALEAEQELLHLAKLAEQAPWNYAD